MPLPEPLRSFLRGKGFPPGGGGASPPADARRARLPSRQRGGADTMITRPSRGLEEFFSYIRDQSGLTILDLGGATQQNIDFITNLGHRLYSENFLQALQETFGADETAEQSNPGRIEYFLQQTLNYREGQFDGVLIWDVLEYLAPALRAAVVDRLHKIVRPKSYMLAFFHSDDKLETVPVYAFRIAEKNMLQVIQQGERRPAELFNNRSLEKLFGRFESVKFFLTRERLREVIVKV
jgi:2-polyprenyl-3-methyl-5-hydroxy-6-metoxy-1,4-benzoquinol methylase